MVRHTCLAAALASLVGGAVAWADDVGEPIRLEYVAADGCPDRASFEARVQAHTTRARFVDDGQGRTFELRLGAGQSPGGQMTVRRAGAGEGTRQVHASTCSEAADALALMVALAIDPSAVLVPPPATSASSPAPMPAAPWESAYSVAGPPPAAPAVVPPAAPDRGETAPPSQAPPARSLSLGADLVIAQGVAPTALVGASPFVGWRSVTRSAIAPSIRAAFLRASSSEVDVTGGSATFVWTVGSVDGCILSWPRGSARVLACARVEGGTLQGTGAKIPGAHSNTRTWLAAGPLARGEWDVLAPLFLEADVAALVHITADRFYFVPDTTVYEVPLVGIVASAGVGVHFP
jgi:hypothetical protein